MVNATKLALGPPMAALLAFVTAWALLPAGTAEAICCGSACCMIDGMCRNNGDTNPDNSCQVCDPTNTQTEWTTMPGCGEEDAGGGGGSDAGTGDGGGGGGGGCSVTQHGGATGTGSAAAVLLALGALTVRRRRRQRS